VFNSDRDNLVVCFAVFLSHIVHDTVCVRNLRFFALLWLGFKRNVGEELQVNLGSKTNVLQHYWGPAKKEYQLSMGRLKWLDRFLTNYSRL